ncbi:MAG: 8-oxo-dGTP diphosphatase [Gammaproteobacteria bacterium]|nr:8-oxo-dGTP diphosphatase [Gammaproteobacteria bacterium]
MVQKYALTDINDAWQAVNKATLLFILQHGQVLLIRKKRGLGAGKINGPGGKLDPGESLEQCAIREVSEELCVEPLAPEQFGRLRFQFEDDYSIDVAVFIARDFRGTPTETDEAIPLWYPVEQIPYDEMWADDRIWLPRVLGGETVDGRFVFDGDNMLAHEVTFNQP